MIGAAYDKRLREGNFVRHFLVRRFTRLAPIWWAGLRLSLIAAIISSPRLGSTLRAALEIAPTALLIPNFFSDELFPLNTPGWSLFYELVANCLYALAAPYLSNRLLGAISFSAALVLLGLSERHMSFDGGALWSGAALGLTRVTFSFFTGILIFRLSLAHPQKSTMRSTRHLPLLLLVGLPFLYAFNLQSHYIPFFDWLLVVLITPAFMVACLRCKQASTRLSSAMGNLSYPLYTIHAPVYVATRAIWGRIHSWNEAMPTYLVVLVCSGCLGLAFCLGQKFDSWSQSLLRREIAKFWPISRTAT